MKQHSIVAAIASGKAVDAQTQIQRELGKRVVEAAERVREEVAKTTYGTVQDALKEAFEDDDVEYIKEDNFVLTFKDGSGKTVKWDRKGSSAEAVKKDAEAAVSASTKGKGEIISCEPGTRDDVSEEFGVDQQADVPKAHKTDAEGTDTVTENEGIPGVPPQATIPQTHKAVEEDEDDYKIDLDDDDDKPVLIADDDEEDKELEEALNAYAIRQSKIKADKTKTPEQRATMLAGLKKQHQQERLLAKKQKTAKVSQGVKTVNPKLAADKLQLHKRLTALKIQRDKTIAVHQKHIADIRADQGKQPEQKSAAIQGLRAMIAQTREHFKQQATSLRAVHKS